MPTSRPTTWASGSAVRGMPWWVMTSRAKLAAPEARLAAPGLVGADHGVGIEEEGVGGGQSRGHKGGGQPGPLLGAPVHRGVVDQGLGSPGPGQIGLAQTTEGGVLGPGGVLEPPVLGVGGDVGGPDDDLGQFDSDGSGGVGETRVEGAHAHLHAGVGQPQRVDAPRETTDDSRRSPHQGSSELGQRRLCSHQPRVPGRVLGWARIQSITGVVALTGGIGRFVRTVCEQFPGWRRSLGTVARYRCSVPSLGTVHAMVPVRLAAVSRP